MPAAIYIETHGGTGIGGSDDHAGVDIGRTFTEAPAAARRKSFSATCATAKQRPAASRAAPRSGPTRRWPWPPAPSPRPVRLLPMGKGAPERSTRQWC